MIKKINGYRIFMNKKLGQGAYGTVNMQIMLGLSGRASQYGGSLCGEGPGQIEQ